MTHGLKTRVLIVDDDAKASNWLQRALVGMNDSWEVAAAPSGETALEIMGSNPCHVVVSDMRMPGMTGAELLSRVKTTYPETIRLIIADYADRGSVVACVGTAHQFLSKPCHPEEIRTAIERATLFNTSVRSDRIRNVIAQMEALPSIPAVVNELFEAIRKEDASVEDIGAIIAKDIAMTAKLLQLVNSGFFGLQTEITSPAAAVAFLGIETVKALLLTTQAFASLSSQETGPISPEQLWQHSLKVAERARRIALHVTENRQLAEESFLAGMLHDIGKLALAAQLPAQYAKVFAAAEDLGLSLHAAEEAAFGVHHGDIGGYMLNLWGLAPSVVSAITYHHQPQLEDTQDFSSAAAVYIANAIVHEEAAPGVEYLDAGFLQKLGLADQVPAWRESAAA